MERGHSKGTNTDAETSGAARRTAESCLAVEKEQNFSLKSRLGQDLAQTKTHVTSVELADGDKESRVQASVGGRASFPS